MEMGLELYPDQKSRLSLDISPLEAEKVVEMSVLDQPILTGFPMVLPSDGGLGDRESIRHCCGFSGRVCTRTESNIETNGTVRFEHCRYFLQNCTKRADWLFGGHLPWQGPSV